MPLIWPFIRIFASNIKTMEKSDINQEWFAIVNPNAGNGKGRKDWNRIADILRKNDIRFNMKPTERKGHATEFTRELIAGGYRKIISIGGDGTLNEIINGIFTQDHCPASEIILGLIPVGTGNDWGRMFGIPLIYEGAVQVIKEYKIMLHDIGVISYYTGEEKQKRYFINIAGLGFESIVVKKTNKQKDKGMSNKAIYFYNLLSSLLQYRNTFADITIDGKSTRAKIFSINVGNGRYCGGGMRQTPDALPDDGLLDITIIKEMGRIEIIRSLKLLYDGTILSHPKVDGYRSNNLKVSSDSILYVEADGESLGHTPVEFGIIPSAVNIVYATRLIP
jgi:YegS/Rv2252/BmrU family lipid kinase